MDIAKPVKQRPDQAAAQDALETLRAWAAQADPAEVAALDPAVARVLAAEPEYPSFKRDYPADFQIDGAYKASLPDLQNGPSSLIKGSKQRI